MLKDDNDDDIIITGVSTDNDNDTNDRSDQSIDMQFGSKP